MNGWMIAGTLFLLASVILVFFACIAGSNADDAMGYD